MYGIILDKSLIDEDNFLINLNNEHETLIAKYKFLKDSTVELHESNITNERIQYYYTFRTGKIEHKRIVMEKSNIIMIPDKYRGKIFIIHKGWFKITYENI